MRSARVPQQRLRAAEGGVRPRFPEKNLRKEGFWRGRRGEIIPRSCWRCPGGIVPSSIRVVDRSNHGVRVRTQAEALDRAGPVDYWLRTQTCDSSLYPGASDFWPGSRNYWVG